MLADTKHGAVVSKWPRKRGKAKSGYALYHQLEFGKVAKWAANAIDLDLATAVEMAKGTEQVPRDILQMAAMGLYYEIVSPEGVVFEVARHSNNAQWMLDTVTDLPGYMLYRDNIGWKGLPPGQPGNVLVSDGALPYWGYQGSSVPSGIASANSWGAASTSNYASKGALIVPVSPFRITHAYGEVTEVAGQTYRWGLYEVNSAYTITDILSLSPPWTAATTRSWATTAPLSAPPMLEVGKQYALLHHRTSATGTTSSGLKAGTGNCRGIPIMQSDRFLAYNVTLPTVGKTVSSDGTNPYSHGVIAQI